MPARLCRAIALCAVQKTAGAQSEDVPLFTRRRTGGEWVEVATLPHHQQAMPRNRAKRDAKTAGAQSAAPAGAFRSATAAGGTWRGDRMFLCTSAAQRRRLGGGLGLALPQTGYASFLSSTPRAAPAAAHDAIYDKLQGLINSTTRPCRADKKSLTTLIQKP